MIFQYKVMPNGIGSNPQTLLDEKLFIDIDFSKRSQKNQLKMIEEKFKEFLKKQKNSLKSQNYIHYNQKLKKNEIFKNVKQILMSREEIKKILKEFKNDPRSNEKKALIETIVIFCISAGAFPSAGLGIGLGIFVGNPVGPAGMIVCGLIGGTICGIGGAILGSKIKDWVRAEEKLLELCIKKTKFYKREYIKRFKAIKERYQIEFEKTKDLKDFTDHVTSHFIAVPVKKYETKYPIYEQKIIQSQLQGVTSKINLNRRKNKKEPIKLYPFKPGKIKEEDLVYDLDYLPKLMKRVSNLITKKILSSKQIEAMKLILFNLHNFRSHACDELSVMLFRQCQKEKIKKKKFKNLDEFLGKEKARCSKLLYFIIKESKFIKSKIKKK